MAFSWFKVVRKFLPAWATGDDGAAVATSLALVLDDDNQRWRESVQAQFPSVAVPGALEYAGRERGIPRGRTETDDHFVARARRWRYPLGHRVRGTAFALLEQVSEYWGGMTCRTRDNNMTVHERTAAGVESYTFYPASGLWSWDGNAAAWSRFWLIMYTAGAGTAISEWPTWDDGSFGVATWDAIPATASWAAKGVTPDDVAALRRLFASPTRDAVPWKPAGTKIPFMILVIGDPSITLTPAGLWGSAIVRAAVEASGVVRFLEVQP